MSASIPLEQETIVWCRSCGIPHAAGTAYCTGCSQPLVVDAGLTDGPNTAESADEATSPEANGEGQTGTLARALAARVAQGRPARRQTAPRWPLARRPMPLTDEEIEARAAAIVAQARAEVAAGLDAPRGATEGSAVLDDAETFAPLDFLPPLRERDRLWLVAGLFCCALLILFAIGFVRFFAK